MPDHPPFSEEEEQIIEYYAVELLKLIPRGRPVPEYRQSILEYIRLSEALLKVDDFNSHEIDTTHAMLKRVFEKLSKLGNDGKAMTGLLCLSVKDLRFLSQQQLLSSNTVIFSTSRSR